MDGSAREIYEELGRRIDDTELRSLFERLAADESERVGWWEELTEAWRSSSIGR